MVPTPQFEVIQVQVVIILLKLQVTHTSTVQSTVPVGTSTGTIVKDKLTTFVKEITSTHLHSMCMYDVCVCVTLEIRTRYNTCYPVY